MPTVVSDSKPLKRIGLSTVCKETPDDSRIRTVLSDGRGLSGLSLPLRSPLFRRRFSGLVE